MFRRPPPPLAVALQPGEVAKKFESTWTMRSGAFRLTWIFNDVVARDGLTLRVSFSASVQVLADPAERTLFVETFGKTDVVSDDAVLHHLEPALRGAAGRLAAAEPAETLVESSDRSRWIDTLQAAAEAVAFGCGLRVSAPFELDLSSEALERQRRADAQRAHAQREADARLATAKHAAALLREWQSMHEQWPALSPGELLGRLSPGDQAGAVTDLMAASATEPARFWAVAGNSLVRLDWDAAPAEPVAISLPAALGPLRSVRFDNGRLLIGAQRGVWVLNAADGAILRQLIVSDLVSEHGFSAVVDVNGMLWASHREAGVVAWDPADERPAVQVDVAHLGGSPTALHRLPDGPGVAVDARWISIGPDHAFKVRWTGPSAIASVLTDSDGSIDIICRDGTWMQFDSEGQSRATRSTVPQAVAGCRLPWLWSHRMLIVGEDGALHCFGLNDDIVTQYAVPQGVGRALATAGGKLIAMSADRSGLVGWAAADGRRASVVPISSIARARITDVVGTQTAAIQ